MFVERGLGPGVRGWYHLAVCHRRWLRALKSQGLRSLGFVLSTRVFTFLAPSP